MLWKAPQVSGLLWDPAGIQLCPGVLLSAFALNPPGEHQPWAEAASRRGKQGCLHPSGLLLSWLPAAS